jgi:signal transduction histidine kinase
MAREKSRMIRSYFLIMGVSLVLLFFFLSFFYHLTITRNINKIKLENEVILNLIKKDLEEKFIDSIADVRFLSETPQLKSLLYRKSDLSENEDYLEGYLKIKDNYIAGNIRNNRNNIIIEEHDNPEFKYSPKDNPILVNDITITKLNLEDDNYISRISAPILGDDNEILGSVTLYKENGYFSPILEKYSSTTFLEEENFYWFGVENNKIQNLSKEKGLILKDDSFILGVESGSILNENILFIFDTIDFSIFLPNIKFGEKTPTTWKILVKIPSEEIILIKKQSFKGVMFLGTFIYLFLAMTIYAILKEYYNRKFYEEQLKMKNQKLVENNQTKDKFISVLAHDLKSPFAGVTGIFNILVRKYDSYDEEKKKKLIFSLNDSIQSINTLLLNLLEWSRIQRGHMTFSPMKVKVNDLMTNVSTLLKLNIEAKNIKISNNISDKHFIWGDKYMIETIFRNIISNAVKYTPNSGKIELDSKKKDGYIYIYIRDNGVGIDLETQSKLFKLDEHLTTPGTENEKGTGLGLIITKEFIKLNRGNLEVDSVKGEGTTFTIMLPTYKEL